MRTWLLFSLVLLVAGCAAATWWWAAPRAPARARRRARKSSRSASPAAATRSSTRSPEMQKIVAIFAFALFTVPAAAQEYPNKPIRIVVGYSAGGGNDIIVRVMAPELSKGLGQAVVVENKPGAQSIIAAE